MLDKPVFISGISGGIGKRLALDLLSRGATIRGISRNPVTAHVFFEHNPRVDIRYADITQPETLDNLLDGCGVVYHSAGYLSGNRDLFDSINVQGTVNMLRAAETAAVERFVHVSSIVVYDEAESLTPNIDETATFEKAHTLPYRITKRKADLLAQSYMDRLPVAVARPGEAYGPHQTMWTVLMIMLAKKMLLHPPQAAISGWLNLIYGDNLADALILLGSHPEAPGEIFNIVDGAPMTTHDYFTYLVRLVNRPVLPLPRVVLRAAVSALTKVPFPLPYKEMLTVDSFEHFFNQTTFSNAKLKQKLGWRPPFEPVEAFKATETWLRAQQLL